MNLIRTGFFPNKLQQYIDILCLIDMTNLMINVIGTLHITNLIIKIIKFPRITLLFLALIKFLLRFLKLFKFEQIYSCNF